MSEMPRDPTTYDTVIIPVETVQPGFSLVFNQGEGGQFFQVESVAFHHKRNDDGTSATAYKLTSGPVAGGGEPWDIELAAGSGVVRLLGASKDQP